MNITLKYCIRDRVVHYNEKRLPVDLNETMQMATVGTTIEIIDRVDNLLTLSIKIPTDVPVPA